MGHIDRRQRWQAMAMQLQTLQLVAEGAPRCAGGAGGACAGAPWRRQVAGCTPSGAGAPRPRGLPNRGPPSSPARVFAGHTLRPARAGRWEAAHAMRSRVLEHVRRAAGVATLLDMRR